MNLWEVLVRPVRPFEEQRCQAQMPERCYPDRFSIHLIVREDTRSCSVPNKCNPYPVSFARSPIPAVVRDDVTPFVRCWPSPPGQSCVGCGGTGPSRIGPIDIQGKDITADTLLTQRKFAHYLVKDRKAHYHFTVKGNPATLFEDIKLYFQDRKEPDFIAYDPPDHGRIETRKIWTTTELNPYLNFPHVQQAFVIERESVEKKTGPCSHDIAYGITSRKPHEATAQKLLVINRGHWSIENSCHYILDWNFDEDRSRIRTGYGPENISRLRRFAIGAIKSKGVRSVAQKMRELTCNIRLVFDSLRMTKNSCASARL